jgi:hypothetical protein
VHCGRRCVIADCDKQISSVEATNSAACFVPPKYASFRALLSTLVWGGYSTNCVIKLGKMVLRVAEKMPD